MVAGFYAYALLTELAFVPSLKHQSEDHQGIVGASNKWSGKGVSPLRSDGSQLSGFFGSEIQSKQDA